VLNASEGERERERESEREREREREREKASQVHKKPTVSRTKPSVVWIYAPMSTLPFKALVSTLSTAIPRSCKTFRSLLFCLTVVSSDLMEKEGVRERA
jgi:hypothetical protein